MKKHRVLSMFVLLSFMLALPSLRLQAEEKAAERIELPYLRDANAKIYQLNDGRLEAEIYSTRIHYPDGSGTLQNISNRMIPDDADCMGISYQFRNEANDVIIRMSDQSTPENYPVLMQWNNYEIYIGFEGSNSSGETNYKLPDVMKGRLDEKSYVVYPDVQKKTDYLYAATSSGVKENIIIYENPGKAEYSFRYHIEGMRMIETEEGLKLVNQAGESLMDIGRFCAYDSLEKTTQNIDCRMEDLGNGDYRLTISLNEEWLGSSERAYPVILDPSVTVSGYSYTYDACIVSRYPTTNYCNDENLRSGYDTDYGQRRSMLQFHFGSNVSAINSNLITSASIKIYKHSGAIPNIYAHRVNEYWSSSTVNWNNRPYYSDGTVSTKSVHVGNNWYSMIVTTMVRQWLSGSNSNYGVELIDDNETITDDMHWSTFYSSEGSASYVPVLTIVYSSSGSTGGDTGGSESGGNTGGSSGGNSNENPGTTELGGGFSEKNVSIKVFQDQSYLTEYSSSTYGINTTMAKAAYSFRYRWNIHLEPSYYTVSGMPFESCGKGYFFPCDSTCGLTCQNAYTTPNHHKNYNYNCFFARDHYGYSGFNLALIVTSANLCHKHSDGSHDTCGLGMTPLDTSNHDFAMVSLTNERGTLLNVRVIQHELSHCYGCRDDNDGEYSCSSGSQCIMNSGLDDEPNVYLSTIWCSNCEAYFNRNAH